MNSEKFINSPGLLTESEFIELFGGVYEHSPWIAKKAWRDDMDSSYDSVSMLANALALIVDNADHTRRLELIVSHPDLAGRAAQAGELTDESTLEQASAGIDQCNQEEFERFQTLNEAYKEKFKFPFVMAVKGSNRHLILAAFEKRIKNSYNIEFETAISEIHKIALIRLKELAQTSG